VSEVVVVIGAGQIGRAIARRVGAGKHVLLADLRADNANAAAEVLGNAGYDVSVTTVDVSSRGDVHTSKRAEAMAGQDVVYANLAGDLESMARSVVTAMHDAGVRRLIWISSMGIYDEVPGQRYRTVLDPYRDSARVIEASDLDYTILRLAWFTDADEIDYETTQKGEPFRGGVVSRKSVVVTNSEGEENQRHGDH
jgi:NAD(P)-dependent dehydrogenase (short-subunit alcohol dehydrogenase family)